MKNSSLLTFAILASFCATGFSSTNITPALSEFVSINSTTKVFRAAGLLESNAVARVNQPVSLYDITFETNAWYAVDETAWTNAAGWSCAGIMTNGILDCDTNAITSPLITGPGLRSITVAWSNLYLLEEMIEWSTNGTAWTELETTTDLRETWPSYRLRVRGKSGIGVPGETPVGRLARIAITGHRHPALIGSTNDSAGIVIRVDNPVGNRDAVNLQTLNTRIAEFSGAAHSASNWSSYVAATPVNYDGQPLNFDSRYTMALSNDTLSLAFAGQAVYEIVGGGTVTPRILSFAIDGGTNISIRVTGAVGWRPYPEWCGDLLVGSWTRLATNEFTGSYPAITNGQFTLVFPAVTNSPAFYRTVAIDETGGSNTLSMAIRVPLQVDGEVTGAGMAHYATTQTVSAAVAAAVAPLASTQLLAGTVSGYVTTQTLASTVAPLVSTQLLAATVSGYATTGMLAGPVIGSWNSYVIYSNLTVTATSVTNYNGPVLGTVFDVRGNPDYDSWYATNEWGTYAQLSFEYGSGTNYSCITWQNGGAFYTNSFQLTGTYYGHSPSWTTNYTPGTGTFTVAWIEHTITNRHVALNNGTTDVAVITGPATNQFAPPITAPVRWSGVWTNITAGITNLLQFFDGYATNKVTL